MDVYIGFDSAWTDKASAPGAICALELRNGQAVRFHPPRLVVFSEALDFIRSIRSAEGCTLVALDQPTIVPNVSGMRPVERVAASVVSWLGGGVQPANRSKVGMFCDRSPIWRFMSELGATQAPEHCRTAAAGNYIIEVFPALALPSIDPSFFGRLSAPRYNPARRKTFKLADWQRVASAAAAAFELIRLPQLAAWCMSQIDLTRPHKADQDRLDAMLCLLIALRWRTRPREESFLIGCQERGYMVGPASPEVRARLQVAADLVGVPIA